MKEPQIEEVFVLKIAQFHQNYEETKQNLPVSQAQEQEEAK